MFALYRKGNTHIVDGIECELVRVPIDALDTYRADGWVDNVADLLSSQRLSRKKSQKKKDFCKKLGLKNENKDSDNH